MSDIYSVPFNLLRPIDQHKVKLWRYRYEGYELRRTDDLRDSLEFYLAAKAHEAMQSLAGTMCRSVMGGDEAPSSKKETE